MNFLIFFLVFILIGVLVAAPIIFVQTRKRMREQKNYERGLKMVQLLIHLPPISDDAQAAGRDMRDLIDENVSRAQVIYNIIASTVQKGTFKTRIYGQRHFAFEIVGAKGFAHFYAAVPLSLVDVVKQAIISAYPTTRLEEVADHNIFSPVGKVGGTVGGELHLKKSFAYPIATFQDLKRDTMQSLLNAFSTLEKEDGAGIQILLRPADPSWRKTALALASGKRKGEKENKGGPEEIFNYVRQLGTALVKPPEHKEKENKPPKELSALEQATLNAIEEKTEHPGYEVLIRAVVSSTASHRAAAILNNIVATFSLFDAQGKNGFKYTAAKSIDNFITDYILRIFPQDQNKDILNAVELATMFHFPDQRSIPTSQLERQDSKQVDGPRNVPDEGLLLGYNVFRGVKKPIRLGLSDRQRHMYAVGQTGTGKSTFLENLALQDMLSGNGFAFVDPHGDTAEKLLAMVPRERAEDVIYFCPAEMDYPMGLNLFEYSSPDQKDFLIQETINMLYKLYDPQHQGIMGPRYEHLFRNAALAIMADPNGGTFVDIPKLFRDPQYVKQKLQHVTDPSVLEFWQKEMPQSQRSNDFGEIVSWFVSKFGAFLSNEMMRNIIGQTKSAFDLRDIMDNKKILLVNLSKGRTGLLNMQLLGMIFVMRFQAAAMSRANVPESEREDFALYVDEFQNFSTDSFATIMSEARKYHLNLIVANQFTTQLSEEIRDAVFGNVGTVVSFRVGQRDVESLVKYFQPTFDESDLIRIPNHNTVVRTMIGGVPTQPFSMATLPPLGNPNPELAQALKQLSAAKFGRPKAVVEKEIFDRMATKAPAAPAGGLGGQFGSFAPQGAGVGPAGQPAGPYGAPVAPQPAGAGPLPPMPSKGTFLDDWMTKRTTPGVPAPAAAPAGPFAAPAGRPGVPPAPQLPSFGTSGPFGAQHRAAPVSAPAPAPVASPVASPAPAVPSVPAPVAVPVVSAAVPPTPTPAPPLAATPAAPHELPIEPHGDIAIDKDGNLQLPH
ncbi:MAG TPA: ATP-binding protein [Patescibacteria group bacterium]|nr:ATP-binding protein [Patescibacteria group bacterium]